MYLYRKISMSQLSERFVSENESNESVKSIFTIVGFAMLSIFISTVLIWSYGLSDRNQYMFISVYSVFVLVYCIIMVSVTVINKSAFDYATYNVLLGFTIFMMFMTFGLAIFFLLKYFNIFSFGYDNNRYY